MPAGGYGESRKMTVQKKRSAKSRARSKSRDGGRGAGVESDRTDIGWGLGAESDDEDLFMRRVLFSVFVAVLGCMGAWFMITTVSAGSSGLRDVLSATESASTAQTIMLLCFRDDAAGRETAAELARSEELQAIAGGHDFSLVDLPQGQCALCVGRFEDSDSPELAGLLTQFAQYFEQAAIMPLPE